MNERRSIPFLGIFASNFRNCVFAVLNIIFENDALFSHMWLIFGIVNKVSACFLEMTH
jgi:hypothetical protein